ncbi:protein FAM83E [Aplochiton taeniatus]
MSKSQDQSLDENAVFLPLTEAHPEFLHCERERHALECLMSGGREAFYTQLSVERLGPFLSVEEVNQISAWCKDYHVSQLQLDEDLSEQEGSSNLFSACYFPSQSDTPAPCLELGWPEGVDTWVGRGTATVHTAPPAEGQPPIREIIRRHLQDACKVIAIVTDRLTDGAVIGDLHKAASRGVPVYVILNQRSVQENITPNRLRHPNMRVRALGGKTFCSRENKMVVGEMKNNFLLVDLETVIQGSYSLTWTDAHLHRQLVTVLRGPVVESFDREFRILFAASLPVPDTSNASRHPMDGAYHRNECLDLERPRPLLLEPVSSPPLLSPSDSPLEWEALGVLHRRKYFPDSPVQQHNVSGMQEEAVQNRPLILRVPQTESFSSLSDIMKRLQPQQSSSTQHRGGARTTVSELSRSMLDLGVHNSSHYERTPPVPRLRASCFDPDRMSPAISLMRKRNEDVKSGLLRTSKTFVPTPRPRSTSFGLQFDWRRPQSDSEG